ncbi:hypothetical protein SNEBB_000777 [Seison nebaliae]|nr:hypothetical protein SNEBB_000777 [Seison nebaliae]
MTSTQIGSNKNRLSIVSDPKNCYYTPLAQPETENEEEEDFKYSQDQIQRSYVGVNGTKLELVGTLENSIKNISASTNNTSRTNQIVNKKTKNSSLKSRNILSPRILKKSSKPQAESQNPNNSFNNQIIENNHVISFLSTPSIDKREDFVDSTKRIPQTTTFSDIGTIDDDSNEQERQRLKQSVKLSGIEAEHFSPSAKIHSHNSSHKLKLSSEKDKTDYVDKNQISSQKNNRYPSKSTTLIHYNNTNHNYPPNNKLELFYPSNEKMSYSQHDDDDDKLLHDEECMGQCCHRLARVPCCTLSAFICFIIGIAGLTASELIKIDRLQTLLTQTISDHFPTVRLVIYGVAPALFVLGLLFLIVNTLLHGHTRQSLFWGSRHNTLASVGNGMMMMICYTLHLIIYAVSICLAIFAAYIMYAKYYLCANTDELSNDSFLNNRNLFVKNEEKVICLTMDRLLLPSICAFVSSVVIILALIHFITLMAAAQAHIYEDRMKYTNDNIDVDGEETRM